MMFTDLLKQKRPSVGDRGYNTVKCKHCGQIVLWEHRPLHAIECRQKRSRDKLRQMNLEKDGQALYAVVISRRRGPGLWSPPKAHYVHAKDAAQAKFKFLQSEPKRADIFIIDAGLAIGWWQHESGLITSD